MTNRRSHPAGQQDGDGRSAVGSDPAEPAVPSRPRDTDGLDDYPASGFGSVEERLLLGRSRRVVVAEAAGRRPDVVDALAGRHGELKLCQELVVRLRFGLVDGRETCLSEIGRRLGATRSQVAATLVEALARVLKVADLDDEPEGPRWRRPPMREDGEPVDDQMVSWYGSSVWRRLPAGDWSDGGLAMSWDEAAVLAGPLMTPAPPLLSTACAGRTMVFTLRHWNDTSLYGTVSDRAYLVSPSSDPDPIDGAVRMLIALHRAARLPGLSYPDPAGHLGEVGTEPSPRHVGVRAGVSTGTPETADAIHDGTGAPTDELPRARIESAAFDRQEPTADDPALCEGEM